MFRLHYRLFFFFKKAVYFKTLKYSTRQMHHLLKNTVKPLFAIISEFKAEGTFIKFALAAGVAKSHYLSCSKHRQGSSLHIPSRQGTVSALSPESR